MKKIFLYLTTCIFLFSGCGIPKNEISKDELNEVKNENEVKIDTLNDILSGNRVWPTDIPEDIPEFDDFIKIVSVIRDKDYDWEIRIKCTNAQKDTWMKKIEEANFEKNETGVANKSYVINIKENELLEEEEAEILMDIAINKI